MPHPRAFRQRREAADVPFVSVRISSRRRRGGRGRVVLLPCREPGARSSARRARPGVARAPPGLHGPRAVRVLEEVRSIGTASLGARAPSPGDSFRRGPLAPGSDPRSRRVQPAGDDERSRDRRRAHSATGDAERGVQARSREAARAGIPPDGRDGAGGVLSPVVPHAQPHAREAPLELREETRAGGETPGPDGRRLPVSRVETARRQPGAPGQLPHHLRHQGRLSSSAPKAPLSWSVI